MRCYPPNQPELKLATFVSTEGLADGEKIPGQDVTPEMTVFSYSIATELSDDLITVKKHYLDEIAGLRIGYTKENGDITEFEIIEPETYRESEMADEGVGLVAYSATSLFNIFYQNETNADYLAALRDFIAQKEVDADFLVDQLGLSEAEAENAATIVNEAVDTAEKEDVLDIDLESALTTARINVTVLDRGMGVQGAIVNITDKPGGVECKEEDCQGETDEHGEVTFTLTGVPPDATEITVVAEHPTRLIKKNVKTKVVAFATVNLEIAYSRKLTVQGKGTGNGRVTSIPSGINCDLSGSDGGGECSEYFDSDTEVKLTAEEAEDSTFDGWSGGGCSGTDDCTVTMDQAHTVIATFMKIPDITIPTVTIKSPTSADTYTTTSSSLSIGGTASDDVGVTQVTWANDRGGSGTCTGTANWSKSGITLYGGINVITVTARDAAGKVGTDTLTVTANIDISVPTVTIKSPTSADTYTTTSSSLSIGGTASDDVGVTQVTWANDRGGSGTCTGTANWSKSGITLYGGINVITVTARDAAGKVGTDTLTVTANIDISVPTVTIKSPTSADTYTTTSSSLNIGGTASDDVGVTQVTWANDRGGSGTCTGTANWSKSGITLYGGINVITVTARDAAGKVGTDTLTVTANIDIYVPTVTIKSPTSADTYTTTSSSLNIGGTASDDVGVTQVTWANDRGGSGTCTGTANWSKSGIKLYSGINVITVTARDATGKIGTDTLTVTANIDIYVPTVTIKSPTSADTYTTTSSSLNIGGTASDDVGVTQVTWANDRGGSGTCTGTATWSKNGITLYGGINVITVTARDAAGKVGTDTLTVTANIDISVPTVTIKSPTSADTYTTTSSSLNIGGRATDDVGVTQVTWANNRGGSGTCTGTTNWSKSGIKLYSGTNVITVTARDAAGKQGTDTLTVTAKIDISVPTVTITSPTSGTTYATTSSSLNIGGRATDDVGVTQVTWANNRGGSGTCTGTTNWSKSGIKLYSGTNVITVTARDAAGKQGTDTLTVTAKIDISVPTVTITSPTSGTTYATTSSSLNIGGRATDDVGVTQVTWANNRGGSGTCTGTTNWSKSGIKLYSGTNVITVTARDAAGKQGTDTLTVTAKIDISVPTVTITSPTSGTTYATTSSSLNIGGRATDDVGVTQVTWANNRGGSGTCTGTTNWSKSGIKLYSGTNVITVTARDAAGKQGTDTLTVTAKIDISVPTVTITSPTSGTTYATTSSSLNIGGRATDDVGVTQVTWANNRGGSGTCTGTTNWSKSGIKLYSGTNVITVTARDAAGKQGTDTLTVTAKIDISVPTVTITSPTSGTTYATTSSSLNIGGRATDDVGVTQVTWANNRGGSGTCTGTTNWSKSGIKLYSGTNVITVTARDAAGKQGTDTLTVTAKIDISVPTVTITSPTSGTTYATTSSSLNIGGRATDDVGVTQVTWANNRGGSGTCTGTTNWSKSGIKLYSGTNVITVTARDAAGKQGTDALTVTQVQPLVAPTLISPKTDAQIGINCSKLVKIYFDWSSVSSANKYQIIIRNEKKEKITDTVVTSSSYYLTHYLPKTSYIFNYKEWRWSVRAGHDYFGFDLWGDWAELSITNNQGRRFILYDTCIY